MPGAAAVKVQVVVVIWDVWVIHCDTSQGGGGEQGGRRSSGS